MGWIGLGCIVSVAPPLSSFRLLFFLLSFVAPLFLLYIPLLPPLLFVEREMWAYRYSAFVSYPQLSSRMHEHGRCV